MFPFDWYYKGSGKGIISNNQNLVFYDGNDYCGGYELELCIVTSIDHNLRPVYRGYTLALDYTDVGMRRKYENMANLSHLSETAISNNLIADDFPQDIAVETKIERKNNQIWCFKGKAGMKYMGYNYNLLLNYLFSRQWILEEGMTFYTLTGSIVSTSKCGISLYDEDVITSKLPEFGISMTNKFKVK